MSSTSSVPDGPPDELSTEDLEEVVGGYDQDGYSDQQASSNKYHNLPDGSGSGFGE